jgi:arylsulfatase A-like enzyme
MTRPAIPLEGASDTKTATGYLYHGIRSGKWKWIDRTSGMDELYDLSSDPYELTNVAARKGFTQTPEQAAAEQNMQTLEATYSNCSGDGCH